MSWEAVDEQVVRLKETNLRALFETDTSRFGKFSRSLDELTIDFSKEKIDDEALTALLTRARDAEVEAKRDAMFAGAPINSTEGRAVLHVAARDPQGSYDAEGADEVSDTLDRFLNFAEEIRSEGKFTDVISIGIGGSDLGPAMAVKALAPDADGPRIHFIANVDGANFTDVTKTLDPATTLVIVQSKTFTTLETMTNAETARAWLAVGVGAESAKAQMAAVSTNLEATSAFGIDPKRVFGFWDWVGGRYSVWTAIGLPLAIAVGAKNFRAMLRGAHEIDTHFKTAALEENLPVLMGLIGVWRREMGYTSTAIIPYDERLSRFPAYLQQLTMESNGKRVTKSGSASARQTCPVVWGEPGTNAQHSFFQLIHQGTDPIPVDFLLAAQPREQLGDHHTKLAANCFAQSKALAFGKTEDEVRDAMQAGGADAAQIDALAPHRTFPGDRPSTTILYRELDAETLGRLIALYEHKTFVEAAIWDINAFDQWGVELGKVLAKSIQPVVEGGDSSGEDSSTDGLISRFKELRS